MAELQTNVRTGDLKITTPETGATIVSSEPPVIGGDKKVIVEPLEQKTSEEDLVSRVSKVKVEPPKSVDTNPFGLTKEDYDKVQSDPVLSKFYKSMQSDYIRKTQEVADEKKKLAQPLTWTTERLQQEMSKPDFIQSAQQLTQQSNPPGSGLTDQEYSTLTDKEKAQLQEQSKRIAQLEMQNWQMQQSQQDEQLKTKYANYAPDIVDTTIHKLVKGEVRADREVVWKALDYDDAVRRAYQLGKQDRQLETVEKTQFMSIEGFSATPQSDVPKPEKGESDTAYFKRLAQRRLAEFKGQNR